MVMKPLNEIALDRAEFKKAVGWVSKSRKDLAQQTFLVFEADGFTVVTPQATTKVKSSGRWVTPIAIPAQYLKAWVNGLPQSKEVTLSWAEGWLSAGRFRLKANPVAQDMIATILNDTANE